MGGNIELKYMVGETVKKAYLTQPYGVGDDSWWLMVDNYYWGALMVRDGNYVFYGNGEIYGDDISILVETIAGKTD